MVPSDDVAITANGLGIRYDLRLTRQTTLRETLAHVLRHPRRRNGSQPLWALRDVTLDLHVGEVLGVVGRNGSGKSTLLLAMAGILTPDSGSVRIFARRPTLLSLGTGFEPQLTGRDNLYLNAAYLGFSRERMDERAEEIIGFSELGALIDAPLWTYSSGMRARLAFSIAAHLDPDVLLLDEVFGVGDVAFQEKSGAKIRELILRAKAIVIVSHQLPFLKEHATRVLWLDSGQMAACGNTEDTIDRYVAQAKRAAGPVRALSA